MALNNYECTTCPTNFTTPEIRIRGLNRKFPDNVFCCKNCGHTMIVDEQTGSIRDLTADEAEKLAELPGFQRYIDKRNKLIEWLYG
jgi:DNA-directed RNA polymerase subunit RPC12/RpoP